VRPPLRRQLHVKRSLVATHSRPALVRTVCLASSNIHPQASHLLIPATRIARHSLVSTATQSHPRNVSLSCHYLTRRPPLAGSYQPEVHVEVRARIPSSAFASTQSRFGKPAESGPGSCVYCVCDDVGMIVAYYKYFSLKGLRLIVPIFCRPW
jgi:hypothetical protein